MVSLNSGSFRKSMSAENVSGLMYPSPSFKKESKEAKDDKIKVGEVPIDSEDERSDKSDEGQSDGKDESSKENSSTMRSFLHSPSVQQGIQKISVFEES